MTDMKEKFAFLLLNTVSAGIFQVNGVRGKCAFSSLGDWFDIVMGFVPDYMHCVLQGITKTLLRLWFSPVYKHHDFFIGDKVSSEVTHLVCIRIFRLVFSAAIILLKSLKISYFSSNLALS